ERRGYQVIDTRGAVLARSMPVDIPAHQRRRVTANPRTGSVDARSHGKRWTRLRTDNAAGLPTSDGATHPAVRVREARQSPHVGRDENMIDVEVRGPTIHLKSFTAAPDEPRSTSETCCRAQREDCPDSSTRYSSPEW